MSASGYVDFVQLIRMEQRMLERDYASIGLAPRMKIEAEVRALVAASEALRAKVQPGKGEMRLIDGPEIWRSLAAAIVAIARSRRSCRFSAKDLKDLVEEYCPREDLAFWAAQHQGRIIGLLTESQRPRGYGAPRDSHLSQLRKLIEDTGGVMFWDEDADPAQEWRLIDTRWLTAHADIRRWVTDPFPGGRRCRFCSLLENPHVNALQPVELERRAGMTMVGDVISLPVGVVLTHERCRHHWLDWLRIASGYEDQAQAEEADATTGRSSRYERVQALQLEGASVNGQ